MEAIQGSANFTAFPDGPAGIPLDSELIEKCRPDMADLRLVSPDGSLVPFNIMEGMVGDDVEPFPAKVFRMGRKQGKWTDIWIDKQAKILTQGVLIQTSSKDFVRKVEIRGSDNAKETYVVMMDGLIADMAGPAPVRSLNVLYHVNNFQYVHIRIIDDDKPPLKVEGVLCYPPPADTSLSSADRPSDQRKPSGPFRRLDNNRSRPGRKTISRCQCPGLFSRE